MLAKLTFLNVALVVVAGINALGAEKAVPSTLTVDRDSEGAPRIRMICSNRATDARMALLPQYPDVENVSAFGGDNFTDSGLEYLARLPKLKALGVGGRHLTAAGLEPLRGHQGLRSLTIAQMTVNAPLADWIVSLPNLEELHLRATVSDDQVWERIANHPKIRNLSISSFTVTNRELPHLGKLKRLRSFYVAMISSPEILHTLRMELRNTVINLPLNPYSLDELRAISKSVETDSDENIVGVNQSCLTYATDQKMQVLADFPTIRRLTIRGGSALTDKGLRWLNELEKLEKLEISSTAITDAGLVSLGALSELRELNFHAPNVTDAGIAELRKALPQCRINVHVVARSVQP